MIRVQCPKCGRPWGVDNSEAGQLWTCPGCRQELQIPSNVVSTPAAQVVVRQPGSQNPQRSRPQRVDESSPRLRGSPVERPPQSARPSGSSPALPRQAPPEEPFRLQEIASEPVVELEPVEEAHRETPRSGKSQEAHVDDAPAVAELEPEEPPILAELDRDEDDAIARHDLDEPLDVIFRERKSRPGLDESGLRRRGPSNLLVAMLMGGIAVATAVGGLVLYRGDKPKDAAVADPAAAMIAALTEKGATIERDASDPDQAVIAITVSGPGFKSTDLLYLKDLPRLRKLNLSHTPVSNQDLAQLEGLNELEELDLSATKVSDAGLVALKKLGNLRKLNLSQTIVTDVGLKELKGLVKLEELTLVDSLADGRGIKEALPKIRVRR